jgi:post-segregation antitoxin (ccd killing protein)
MAGRGMMRINITMPRWMHQYVKDEGINLSALVQDTLLFRAGKRKVREYREKEEREKKNAQTLQDVSEQSDMQTHEE